MLTAICTRAMQEIIAAYNTSYIHKIEHTAHLQPLTALLNNWFGLMQERFCAHPDSQTHQILLTKSPGWGSLGYIIHLRTHSCAELTRSSHAGPASCYVCMLCMQCGAKLCQVPKDWQLQWLWLGAIRRKSTAKLSPDSADCDCHPIKQVMQM